MFEMPSTMVRKMIGPITIFTSFTNVSPTGRRARPRAGSSAPTRAPSATAHKPWNGRLRGGGLIRGEPRESGRGTTLATQGAVHRPRKGESNEAGATHGIAVPGAGDGE